MATEIIQPDGWLPPKGYSNGVVITGTRTLCVAGMVGWDAQCRMVDGGFVAQFRQALANIRAVVEKAGGTVDRVGKLTVYVTDKREYTADLRAVGTAYREVFGRHYPAMALVEVKGLLEPGALVEIEALAVLE